uniref:Uncharacterized protein LOC105649746 isoform X3 n=1 Tax=Rhizophora mucronata TaxID=61149 RepID=A0A2P2LAW1_RHIMU
MVSILLQVWFWEQDRLPIVSSSSEEQQRYKILMKSPWEILQSPVGSGGAISLLASHNILENLIEMGVEYIEVLSASQNNIDWSPLLLGYVDSCQTKMGVQVVREDMKGSEENFDIVFSINFMKSLTKHMDKLHFDATLKPNSHVELVDKEWIEVVPSSSNSYELSCSIYSALNACSPDKICVMEIA